VIAFGILDLAGTSGAQRDDHRDDREGGDHTRPPSNQVRGALAEPRHVAASNDSQGEENTEQDNRRLPRLERPNEVHGLAEPREHEGSGQDRCLDHVRVRLGAKAHG